MELVLAEVTPTHSVSLFEASEALGWRGSLGRLLWLFPVLFRGLLSPRDEVLVLHALGHELVEDCYEDGEREEEALFVEVFLQELLELGPDLLDLEVPVHDLDFLVLLILLDVRPLFVHYFLQVSLLVFGRDFQVVGLAVIFSNENAFEESVHFLQKKSHFPNALHLSQRLEEGFPFLLLGNPETLVQCQKPAVIFLYFQTEFSKELHVQDEDLLVGYQEGVHAFVHEFKYRLAVFRTQLLTQLRKPLLLQHGNQDLLRLLVLLH